MCSCCPNLEKKLSDMKTEKETLKTKIIQLKFKQEEIRRQRIKKKKEGKRKTYNSACSTEAESADIGRLVNH